MAKTVTSSNGPVVNDVAYYTFSNTLTKSLDSDYWSGFK